MKKQEFLNKLKSRISILDDEEVADILTEYESHINEKVNAGKTEEEAIQDFGDFNELVKDILGAYKIKDKGPSESRSQGEFEAWIHKAVDEITDFMRPLVDKISKLEQDQIGYFIGYILLTLVMVYLIQVPFWIVRELGVWVLRVIPFGVGIAIGAVFSVVLRIAQLVVSIVIIIYGLQRAIEAATLKKTVNFGYTSNHSKEKATQNEPKEPKEKVEPKPQAAPQPEVKAAQASPSTQTIHVEPKVNAEEKTSKKKEPVIFPAIGALFIVLFKGFVFLCMLPGFMIALGLMICLGIMIALFFKGIYFIGLFLILIGLLTATTTILDMIYSNVFRKRVRHA